MNDPSLWALRYRSVWGGSIQFKICRAYDLHKPELRVRYLAHCQINCPPIQIHFSLEYGQGAERQVFVLEVGVTLKWVAAKFSANRGTAFR